MLKKFLVLYLKRSKKGILFFLTIVSIIALIGLLINQWFIILTIIFAISVTYYVYLEIKQAKVSIILDTCNLQKIYANQLQEPAVIGKRFTKSYKKWLMQHALEHELDINYIFFLYSQLNYCCCYCFFNLIPWLLIFVMSSLYLSAIQAWIISLIFLGFSITVLILTERKASKEKYRLLDSEIKRIVFEEQTGYSPIVNKKFTFKYRIWLIINERKQNESILVNNI